MKEAFGYTVNKAAHMGLDITDLALLRYFEEIGWKYIKSTQYDTHKWVRGFELDFKAIVEELPVIKLSDDDIQKRVAHLVKLGILSEPEISVYMFTDKLNTLYK